MNGLKFRVKGSDVSTIVKLGAGFFVDGQPKIIERIFACIEERMNSAGKWNFTENTNISS